MAAMQAPEFVHAKTTSASGARPFAGFLLSEAVQAACADTLQVGDDTYAVSCAIPLIKML
jgi:hypothetical protein